MTKPSYLVTVQARTCADETAENTVELSEKEYKSLLPKLKKISKALKTKEGEWYTNNVGDSATDYVEQGLLTEEEAEWLTDNAPDGDGGLYNIEGITAHKYLGKETIY